jgi:hypothetical protein
VAFISEKRILRGWLAGEVLQPLVDLEVPLASGGSSRVRGVGDLTLGAGLQWVPTKVGNAVLVQRFTFDVTVPTGTYSDRQPVNIGSHGVSLDPPQLRGLLRSSQEL